jgi:UDP-glucose:(heptosyl)LPS alpha-1,3-glucosyltransferase
LVVHDYNRVYGHSRYVSELARRFRHEHDVHVFSNTLDDTDTEHITFHHVPAWRRNVMTTLLSFPLMAYALVRGRFHIIHAQGFCGLRQNVVTAHMCQGAWLDAMARNARPHGWRKRLFHRLAGWLEGRTYSPAATRRVIAVAQHVESDLRRHNGSMAPIRVIHHGVDGETFHPRNRELWRGTIRKQLDLPDDVLVALYVGDYQKGLEPAIRAVARVSGLILVGVARSPTAPYQSLIVSEGVTNRVRLLPATPQIEQYYAAADVFLFPTVYDPFGLVITEAMASGLPVITSRAAGAAELITPGLDGFVTDEAWDVDAIAAHLTTLRDNSTLREAVGHAARRRV